MIRLAAAEDAEQLELLNNEFNGQGEIRPDDIRNSLLNNKQEIAKDMLSFAEEYCRRHCEFSSLELLTGEDNLTAQAVYHSLGYKRDREVHMIKHQKSNRHSPKW